MRWSIVIPVLNEGSGIVRCLEELQAFRELAELIVVDGGSDDQSAPLAQALCDRLIISSPGRACQMNAGAAAAQGDALLFLHADTMLPSLPVFPDENVGDLSWGFYPVTFDSAKSRFRVLAWFMNQRSSLTGVATGDQAIFVSRELFNSLGGYADLRLMEDVELSKRLRDVSSPCVQRHPAKTSRRRWDQRGFVRTVLNMWAMRLAYVVGVSPDRLARYYYG
jgi:rSAM/selenodomain-associated transferase 2